VLSAQGGPAGTAANVGGLVELPLAQEFIATPYGVGSSSDQSNNTGNARRDKDPTHDNKRLTDFTGRVALTVVGAGVRLPNGAAE
jgi:hypothetical protein